MKYEIVYSKNFKSSLKKVLKQGKDIDDLLYVAGLLANKNKLSFKYKNHKLINNKKYKDCYECHIEPDWLLVYKYSHKKLILLLVDTGSHSDLF